MKKVCVCVPSLLVESSPMLHALPFADVSRLLHAFVGPTLSSLVLYLVHIAYKQYMSIDGSFDVIHTSIYRLRSWSAFSLHGNTLPWNTMIGVTSCEQSISTFSRNMSMYLGNPTNRLQCQFFSAYSLVVSLVVNQTVHAPSAIVFCCPIDCICCKTFK